MENELNKFKAVIEEKKPSRIAIFSHAYPDPDALGSIMSLEWLINKMYNIPCQGFYYGSVSHPQNVAFVNLIDPNIRHIDEYDPKQYTLNILVDTVPSNAGCNKKDIQFDIVIDHHKENCAADFSGLFINLKAGSCCGTIFSLIESSGIKFGDGNDTDARVATAMLIGISTDTENLMSDDTTVFEFNAWAKLFEYRSPIIMKKIVNFSRPRFWVDQKSIATKNAEIDDGIAVVGMGIVPGKHRDLIADMAQDMVSWEDVHTAIVFAIIDGTRIEGSVRSVNSSISIPKLSKELGGKNGNGGGKLGKGAYKYELGGGSIGDDDDDDIKAKTWELINEKETRRIKKVIKQ